IRKNSRATRRFSAEVLQGDRFHLGLLRFRLSHLLVLEGPGVLRRGRVGSYQLGILGVMQGVRKPQASRGRKVQPRLVQPSRIWITTHWSLYSSPAPFVKNLLRIFPSRAFAWI